VRSRGRALAAVGAAAALAAALVVGTVELTRSSVKKLRPVCPHGVPFVPDRQAPAPLRAQVRAAVEARASRELDSLAVAHPRSAFVLLHLGFERFCARDGTAAVAAWRRAVRVDRDTSSAVRADDLLHPNAPSGLPPFVPSFAPPGRGVQRLLVRGVRLQEEGRPVSAERVFAAAAARAPQNAEAQVAAAVGLYAKDRPALAFSRLGPLSKRFPRAQTVRFHLGLLLIFIRGFAEARRQLTIARAEGPSTRLGIAAETFLRRLPKGGTGPPRR
jgi:hypothetical protein